MNIFLLDHDLRKAARENVDRHMKIILEIAQMLSTVLHVNGPKDKKADVSMLYKPSHMKHGTTVWTGASLSNWRYMRRLARELNRENRYRYGKDHKSWLVIRGMPEPNIPDLGLTPVYQAMPEVCRVPNDHVQAYRNVYVYAKTHLFSWNKREPPEWLYRHHRSLSIPPLNWSPHFYESE